MKRSEAVTTDDLREAVAWLRVDEGQFAVINGDALERVAAFLEREAARRNGRKKPRHHAALPDNGTCGHCGLPVNAPIHRLPPGDPHRGDHTVPR